MSNHQYRRVFGLLFGLLIGLGYGVISESINPIFLPGIPLYHAPFGFWGNIGVPILIGLALGIITAWPRVGGWGIFWGSVTGALVISMVTALTVRRETLGLAIGSLAMIFMPLAGGCALLLIAFRWIVDREVNTRFDVRPARRLALPLAAVLAAALTGSLWLYPPMGRTVTARMNELILQGRQARSIEELPAVLRPNAVRAFMEKGQAGYQLAWEVDAENRYRIARRLTEPYQPSTVIARFDNGWLLVCVFSNTTEPPACRDF